MRRFFRNAEGVAGVEFALIAPLMIFFLMGCAALFIAARDDQRCRRATYTVSDLVSRQSSIDQAFFTALRGMLANIAPGRAAAPVLRVTSITRKDGAFAVDWSLASPKHPVMDNAAIPLGRIPDVPDGQSLVIVDTEVPTSLPFPRFTASITSHRNISVMRPRFVAKIGKTG